MDGGASGPGELYVPPPVLVEDKREPLLDVDASDSTELWLIRWPKSGTPCFVDGQEITLELDHEEGTLGTFKDSSGKEYSLYGESPPGSPPKVLTSSSSGVKIVGNISRRVLLTPCLNPNELKKLASDDSRPSYHGPFRMPLTNASCQSSCVTTNSKLRSHPFSTRSGRQRRGVYDAREISKPYNRGHPRESTASLASGSGTQETGRGYSDATTAEFSEHSSVDDSAASSVELL